MKIKFIHVILLQKNNYVARDVALIETLWPHKKCMTEILRI